MWPGLRAGCWGRCGLPRKDASQGPRLTLESPAEAESRRGGLVRGLSPRETGSAAQKQAVAPGPEAGSPQCPVCPLGAKLLVLRIHPNGAKKPRSRKDAPPGAARPPLPPSWRSTFSVSSPARRLPVASGGGRSEGVPPAAPWARLVLSRGLDPERSRGC